MSNSSDRSPRDAPLAGLRVLDLSVTLPGPFSTQALADLGADVIKVESPAGDMTRASPTGLFPVSNRNKRSVVLDLKTQAGVATCLDLASRSDVFVEGFRPGVVARLGVGYDQVRGVKPDIVYCSISGYGQTGPQALAPGHDVNYLAASGALSYSGRWRRSGPQRPALPVADLSAALYATVSILAALRRRDATGEGAYIDIALADCAMALASARGGPNQSIRDADRLHLFPSNDLFTCAGGQVLSLGVVEEHFWHSLCKAAGTHEPRLADPKFASEALRRRHGDELSQVLEEMFATATADEWLRRFEGADIPVQKVLTLDEAVQTPQAAHRGIVRELDGQRHVMFPAVWNGKPIAQLRRNGPALGAHTQEVLARQPGEAAR